MTETDTATPDVLQVDEYWAQLPRWVLTDASPRAAQIYGFLRLRAMTDPAAFPSRRTLANEARCSRDTVDRAIKELVSIGALEVTPFYGPRDPETRAKASPSELKRQSSNTYLIVSIRRGGRIDAEGGVRVDADAPGRIDAAQKEIPFDIDSDEGELAPRRETKPDYAWDFLTHIDGPFGLAAGTTSQRKRVGRLAADINATLDHHGIVGEDRGPALVGAVMAWPTHYPDMNLTPNALEVHLAALLGPPLRRSKQDMDRQRARDMIAAGPGPKSEAQLRAEARR